MDGATPSLPRIPTWRGTFPLDRCAACDRRLNETDEAPVGQFPIFTPDRLLLIRCRMCAECLDQPELREPSGLRRQARALVAHLWHWWAGAHPSLSSRVQKSRRARMPYPTAPADRFQGKHRATGGW
jgi:hypothetical protein